MVLFNYSTKELTAKIVYYGPGLCGKTTNLQWIHEKTPIKNKGKMLSLATEADRTLFFDFLPIELGTIRGMKTRIQLYTVPGQVFYNATRRMVLKGADCVVFVADSQEPMIDANLDSLANLKENLEANEINPDEIPMVVQFNKRDLPNALPVEILNDRLNPRNRPFFEAVAMKGQGVEETLKGATSLVFRHLASKYGDGSAAGASTSRPSPPAPARPPSPAPPAPAPAGPGTVAAPPRPPTVSVPRAAAAAAVSGPRPPLVPAPPPRPAPPPPPPAPEDHEEELSFDVELAGDVETISVDELALDEPAAPMPAPPVAPVAAGRSVPAVAKTTLVKGADETEDMRRRISRPLEPELTLDALDEEDIEEISLEAPVAPPPRTDGPGRPGGRTSTLPPVPSAATPLPPPSAPPRPPAVQNAAARPATTTAPPGSRAVAPSAPAPARAAAPPGPATNPGAPRFTGAASPSATIAPVNVTLRGDAPTEIAIPVDVKVQHGSANVEVHIKLTLNLKLIP